MNIRGVEFPEKIETGAWGGCHIQGIAVDPVGGFVYYSFTTLLVKARLDGTVVGWVDGLLGHLGCIDFNDEDGKVYGSLEFKHDAIGKGIMEKLGAQIADEDAFYIAVFDVDKINRPRMDAEADGVMRAVYMPKVVDWYNRKNTDGSELEFGVTGIDGLGIGPVFGESANSRSMLMVCAGGYLGSEYTKETCLDFIFQFDWRELDAIAEPLSQSVPHHKGIYPDKTYGLDISWTTWGVQNLEYDAYDQSWIVAVYKGKKEGYPNLPTYIIDGTRAPIERESSYADATSYVVLKESGIHHAETGIWGNRFDKGATGVYSFGEGHYYFSYSFVSEKGQESILKLCRRTSDAECPFEPIE